MVVGSVVTDVMVVVAVVLTVEVAVVYEVP